MAKWKSVIFSDIRNKLGNQVVFSNWKGRGYMRAFVIPANPKTPKQQANRDHQAKLVAEWKATKKGDADAVAVWNTYSLDYGISGYNLFVRFGRKSSISVPETASGTGSATVTITFDMGLLGSDGVIIVKTPSETYEVITPEGTSGTYDYSATENGEFEFWIGSKKILDEYGGAGTPELVARINNWSLDVVNGIAKAAKCNVTVS